METCIAIPAYNAVKTITEVAREALQTGFPVLVIDDGSDDGTAESLKGLPVNLLSHRENCGKGRALRTAFGWALQHGFSGIVTLDADGQHDVSGTPLLIATAKRTQSDLVIGSRAVQFRQMAGLRSSWNRFGSWCMERRTGLDISDSQSGFRYYSAHLLRGVDIGADGYDMEMEILLKAWRNGFRIASVPIAAKVIDGRSTSHFRAVQDTWKICMTFLRHM